MNPPNLPEENYNNVFGDIDLELLDLILKGYFSNVKRLLDVGCGDGRNLIYFLQKEFEIYAIDQDKSCVELVRYMVRNFERDPERIIHAAILDRTFSKNFFDAVLCSRVLHFSESEQSFLRSWYKMHEILKPGGLLYVSSDTMIGFERNVRRIDSEKWQFSDGSVRFLVSNELLQKMDIEKHFEWIAPMKTIHYGDHHAQVVFCLKKRS